ncbi:MAG: isoprenylcysteine carboxylmethyltransferase family protein [Hyphomicrobiaceae bacterium]|nr:isoprenylcysteine carboxylmethyltransferase family protein [Hyphomicrobiaceae bacterium]
MQSSEPEPTSALTGPERPGAIPWPPVLLAVAALAALMLGRHYPLAWPGLDDAAARFIGVGLGVAGLALILWAAMTLWRHKTTVLPHRGASDLVTDGPFRWRRNPIYIGDALVLLGLAEMTKNVWFAILVPVFLALVTWLAILPEERHLEARFGERWRAYRDRTRRLI